MKISDKVLKYNIINIVTVIICVVLFFVQLFILLNNVINISTHIVEILVASLIMLWPFMVMVVVIKSNKRNLIEFIHDITKQSYPKINSNNDVLKKVEASLTYEEQKVLPKFMTLGKGYSGESKFRKLASGRINNLNMSYKIDEFRYLIEDKKKVRIDFRGDALVTTFDNFNFGSHPIIFANMEMRQHVLGASNVPINEIKIDDVGSIFYDIISHDEELLLEIKQIILQETRGFLTKGLTYIVFSNNNVMIFTDVGHIYGMKVPFIVSQKNINSLLRIQKNKIYQFRNFLINLSKITK